MTQRGFRQGDVLVVPAKSIPPTAVAADPENGRLILARGEATGHHHSFPWQRGAVLFRDDGAGSGMYVSVSQPVALEHQEHGPHVAAPGNYSVEIQRTYQSGTARRVED